MICCEAHVLGAFPAGCAHETQSAVLAGTSKVTFSDSMDTSVLAREAPGPEFTLCVLVSTRARETHPHLADCWALTGAQSPCHCCPRTSPSRSRDSPLWDVCSCARPSDSLSSLLSRSQQAMVRAVLVASEEGQAWQKQKSHPLQTFWILLPKS